MTADDVRRNILQRTGSQWWADRLVPVLPGDTETVPRARLLQQSLLQQWGANQTLAQVAVTRKAHKKFLIAIETAQEDQKNAFFWEIRNCPYLVSVVFIPAYQAALTPDG